MSAVRSATIRMSYKGQDIARYCTAFTFTSNAFGELDRVEITLEDRDGRVWQGGKWPARGDLLEPLIVTSNWFRPGDRHELACGVFELDQPEVSGPPDMLALRGSARLVKTAAQAEKKTRGWENTSLRQVAGDLAEGNGYSLDWRGRDREYPRLDQKQEADLQLLERLAREAGNGVKVSGRTIAVIDVAGLEDQPPTWICDRLRGRDGGLAVIDYRFTTELHDKYKSCRVMWHDVAKGELFAGVYDDPLTPSGESLRICDKKVASNGEAEALAKEILLARNRPDINGELTVVGDTTVLAGMTCELREFGGFSGKYLVQSASHQPLGGYVTRLAIRKVKR